MWSICGNISSLIRSSQAPPLSAPIRPAGFDAERSIRQKRLINGKRRFMAACCSSSIRLRQTRRPAARLRWRILQEFGSRKKAEEHVRRMIFLRQREGCKLVETWEAEDRLFAKTGSSPRSRTPTGPSSGRGPASGLRRGLRRGLGQIEAEHACGGRRRITAPPRMTIMTISRQPGSARVRSRKQYCL
jgi:hypothetical protein